jgi:hypothetical protein
MGIIGSILRSLSSSKKTDPQLQRWRASETRSIKRPRDKRTKYCISNIGKEIVVKYHGTRRTIKPVRVFTKPTYRKTYVEAVENGKRKTFDIDDIVLVSVKKRPTKTRRWFPW